MIIILCIILYIMDVSNMTGISHQASSTPSRAITQTVKKLKENPDECFKQRPTLDEFTGLLKDKLKMLASSENKDDFYTECCKRIPNLTSQSIFKMTKKGKIDAHHVENVYKYLCDNGLTDSSTHLLHDKYEAINKMIKEGKAISKWYHKIQSTLLELELNNPEYAYLQECNRLRKKGQPNLPRNEFSKLMDDQTMKWWIRYCDPNKDTSEYNLQLNKIAELVFQVSLGRIVSIAATPHNLAVEKEFICWRNHVQIIMTFAAWFVVLDACHVKSGYPELSYITSMSVLPKQ